LPLGPQSDIRVSLFEACLEVVGRTAIFGIQDTHVLSRDIPGNLARDEVINGPVVTPKLGNPDQGAGTVAATADQRNHQYQQLRTHVILIPEL